MSHLFFNPRNSFFLDPWRNLMRRSYRLLQMNVTTTVTCSAWPIPIFIMDKPKWSLRICADCQTDLKSASDQNHCSFPVEEWLIYDSQLWISFHKIWTVGCILAGRSCPRMSQLTEYKYISSSFLVCPTIFWNKNGFSLF